MPTNTRASSPANLAEALANFAAANEVRNRDGAAHQVARAEAALPKLLKAPCDLDRMRSQVVLWRYQQAVRLRIQYPEATVAELAAKNEMSKGRYWSILRRALRFAETIPDRVIFK
jgi:DNA-binding transcriptional regulator WhiA